MKLLTCRSTSHHLLLCVVFSLQWIAVDSTTLATATQSSGTATTDTPELKMTDTPLPMTTVGPPAGVGEVTVVTQTETSITLNWNSVENISSYSLHYTEKGIDEVKDIPASDALTVEYVVLDLTAGTEYSFTLYTVFHGVNSIGKVFTAVTAPTNVDDVRVENQNETSITLRWTKVNRISTYKLEYTENGVPVQENIPAPSEGSSEAEYVVSKLTAATNYSFILYTVFEDVSSSGYHFTAVTAPENVAEMTVVSRNETSITLGWTKVHNISTYTLQYTENGIPMEKNIISSSANPSVEYPVALLNAGTRYNFTLLTVFGDVKSRGFLFPAVTAPTNVEHVTPLSQNETSITLEWTKVNSISTYTLQYTENGNATEKTITATDEASVQYVVKPLNAGTRYNFTLLTVFEDAISSGLLFTAVTAPRNTEEFKSIGQDETSITLRWQKVNGSQSYILAFNMGEIPIGGSVVTHTISNLTSATVFNFTIFTLFENVRSSGKGLTAVTAPENVKNVTVVNQTENRITLKWNKVKNISTYFLLYDETTNSGPININSSIANQPESITWEVSLADAGRKYDFTLITVFERVNSTGYIFIAATVPPKVPSVTVDERFVASITLRWKNANKDWNYLVQVDGHPEAVDSTDSDYVSHPITSLKAGTEYTFNVITVFFGLKSTPTEVFSVTAIDCSAVNWHVTSTSIQGFVEGAFSSANATNKTLDNHVSLGGEKVLFTGLYPGAMYEIKLLYAKPSVVYEQCTHNIRVNPSDLNAHCEYEASGYSIRVVWDKPYGLWTHVEMNVSGKYEKEYKESYRIISGFQPAQTYKVSMTLFSSDVSSENPFVFDCSTDPRGVIAGSVIGVLLFVILVCVVVFIVLKKPEILRRKKSFIRGSKPSTKKSLPIPVTKFPEHFFQLSMDENRGFGQEYESLSPVGTEQAQKAATLPENKVKNRFSNVLPYDWNRVKLTTNLPGSSDYINASYMPGYKSSRDFIASQGPLPSTVNDFWRMIWEQRVKGIVMVTNCLENGRTKCEQYWPAESQSRLFGELSVTTRSEQKEPNWTLRELSVKHKNTSEERTVKHFHFTAWPDHGVPQGTEVLIQFRGLVRQHIEREQTTAPTVVHCSAGVGRTGTIIALDVMLQQVDKERVVGINPFVHKMRMNRPHMVQTESQYVFLHQCIMDSLQQNEKIEDPIYENADMIYVNATALKELR